MATTFRLKRKLFALLAGGSGVPMSVFKGMYKSGLSSGTIKSGTSFTQWYRGTDASAVQNTLAKQRAPKVGNIPTNNSVLGFGSSGSAVASGSPNSKLGEFGKLDLDGGVKTIDNHPKIKTTNTSTGATNAPKTKPTNTNTGGNTAPQNKPTNNSSTAPNTAFYEPKTNPAPAGSPPPSSPAPTADTKTTTTSGDGTTKKGWSKAKKWTVGIGGTALVGAGYAAKKVDDAANGIG